MNPFKKKSLLMIAAVGTVSLGAVTDVSARSFGAAAGRALAAADNACFSDLGGVVTNNCGTAKSFEVQLPVDNTGAKTVSFTAAGGVTCTAGVTDSLNNAFFASTTLFVNSPGITSSGNLSAIPLPAGGKLWIGCTINPGGRLATVIYNQ